MFCVCIEYVVYVLLYLGVLTHRDTIVVSSPWQHMACMVTIATVKSEIYSLWEYCFVKFLFSFHCNIELILRLEFEWDFDTKFIYCRWFYKYFGNCMVLILDKFSEVYSLLAWQIIVWIIVQIHKMGYIQTAKTSFFWSTTWSC